MRQRKTIFYNIFILLLVICLTAGCVAPARPQASAPLAKESAAQESTQSYEQYEKKTIDAQASFDQLTNDLFLDEVDNSLITLHYTLANPAPTASLTTIKPWEPYPWRTVNRLLMMQNP